MASEGSGSGSDAPKAPPSPQKVEIIPLEPKKIIKERGKPLPPAPQPPAPEKRG